MKGSKLYVLGLGLIGLAFCAAAASAQQYKWKDARGHTVYGDVPPPGVEATPVKSVMATPIAPAGTAAGAKAGAKGPKVLTPAEKEMEFRRRVKEAQEAAAKQAKEDQAKRDSQQNCENAREQERTLASGQRVSRVDEKGERYYVDDAQRAQELSQVRRSISEWCK
jgi:type IV secretory pathway VirB10-like protein